MRKYLIRYLVATGVGALVALAAPDLVPMGFVLGVLPGLVLSLMPTAFVWVLPFFLIWELVRKRADEWLAAGLAFGGTAALFFYLPVMPNARTEERAVLLRAADRLPEERIRIGGLVQIDTTHVRWQRGLVCDALCTLLVLTPGVEGVIVNPLPGKRASARPAALFRVNPAVREENLAKTDMQFGLGAGLGRGLEDEWKLKMAQGARIERTTVEGTPDFTISYTLDRGEQASLRWTMGPLPMKETRLRIAAGDEVLLQQTSCETRLLTRPVYIGSNGMFTGWRFQWSRGQALRAELENRFEAVAVLREFTNLDFGRDGGKKADAGFAAEAREQLRVLVGDKERSAADAGFGLVEAVLEDIGGNGWGKGDVELVRDLILDERAREFRGLFAAVQRLPGDGSELRRAIVRRILTAVKPAHAEGMLGRVLMDLPKGVFAELTAEEARLLGDVERREFASGLIRRQADRGVAAVELLVSIVEGRFAGGKRLTPAMRGETTAYYNALFALAVVGREAGPVALPRLEALVAEGRVPADYIREEWLWTLARLGKPVETFTKPGGFQGTEERFRESVRIAVVRFERQLRDGEERARRRRLRR